MMEEYEELIAKLKGTIDYAIDTYIRISGQDLLAIETRKFFDTEGIKIIRFLKYAVEHADDYRELMLSSIKSAIESGKHAMERDLSKKENLYLLIEWASQILPSLKVAFERVIGPPLSLT